MKNAPCLACGARSFYLCDQVIAQIAEEIPAPQHDGAGNIIGHRDRKRRVFCTGLYGTEPPGEWFTCDAPLCRKHTHFGTLFQCGSTSATVVDGRPIVIVNRSGGGKAFHIPDDSCPAHSAEQISMEPVLSPDEVPAIREAIWARIRPTLQPCR